MYLCQSGTHTLMNSNNVYICRLVVKVLTLTAFSSSLWFTTNATIIKIPNI